MLNNSKRNFIIGICIILFSPLLSCIMMKIGYVILPHFITYYYEFYQQYSIEMYVSFLIVGIFLCIYSQINKFKL